MGGLYVIKSSGVIETQDLGVEDAGKQSRKARDRCAWYVVYNETSDMTCTGTQNETGDARNSRQDGATVYQQSYGTGSGTD